MDDLVAVLKFFKARLDDDEAVAHKAAGADGRFGGRPHWSALGRGMVADAADPDWGVVDLGPCIDDDALAVHIARHDPARVLREVTAGRQLLSDYEEARTSEGVAAGVITQILLMQIINRVRVWDDHPDFRQEWNP